MISFLFIKLTSLRIPRDSEVLSHFGHALSPEAPQQFRILVWNVQKAAQRDRWQKDLRHLAAQHEILIFQEANFDSYSEPIWRSLSSFESVFAASFQTTNLRTGLLTASQVKLKGQFFLRSKQTEPISSTPKLTLFTYHQVVGSRELLLIANIHALNFNLNAPFAEQIAHVFDTLVKHAGPILFAGDFNTWNPARLRLLKSKAASVGLEQVLFAEDRRRLVLDHIFVRGLKIEAAKILSDVSTSDHYPLSLSVRTN